MTSAFPSLAIEEVAIDSLRPDPAKPVRISEEALNALTRSRRTPARSAPPGGTVVRLVRPLGWRSARRLRRHATRVGLALLRYIRGSMRPTALIALALVVFGCAWEPARSLAPSVVPTPTALVGDACLLVPDIETIVGRHLLMPPAPYAVGIDANCIWNFNDDPSESVGFGVGLPELYADDVETYTKLRGPGQTVDGLGDAAVLWPPMGQETRLSVRTRTHAISIGIVLETADEARVARAIAASALSHLGD